MRFHQVTHLPTLQKSKTCLITTYASSLVRATKTDSTPTRLPIYMYILVANKIIHTILI